MPLREENNNSNQIMDTNFSKFNDDTEEDNKKYATV
jgi:hypothetical protein